MSSPRNPLSSYRSYSYYHVLVLCDSSATATSLSTDTDINTWQHPQSNDPLGQYAPKTAKNGGQYCVMVNGSTDAAVIITTAKWASVTAGSVVSNDRNTSIAIEGTLALSEPRGIEFLDNIVECCIALGVDSASSVWLLKTFFVGYLAEDGEVHNHITNIEPLMFVVIDVIGSFTEQGGTYELTFVAISHGQTRLPQFSRAGKAVNIPVGDTLGQTLANLAQQINKNYSNYFECVEAQVLAVDPSGNTNKALRKVEYVITAESPYDKDIYKVTDQPIQAKTNMDCSKPATARIDANGSIESGIHSILAMCPQIKVDADTGDGHTKFKPLIHTTVDTHDPAKPVVYYKIIQTIVPHSVSFEDFRVKQGTSVSADLQKNVIEFDYIYTGKNIDILEFDLKMTMGLVYLQAATANASYRTTRNEAQSHTGVNKDDAQIQPVRAGSVVKNIPVYFGSLIKADTNSRNSNDASIAVQSAYTLTKHSSLEMIDASMKITGNPSLLSSVNRQSGPANVKPGGTPTPNSSNVLPDWGVIPSFTKVNIKMPRNNDDIGLFDSTTKGSNYAKDFWFTGYYYIIGMEHVFDGGEFYQKLEMLSIPEKTVDQQTNGSATKNTDVNDKIGKCYDNLIDCFDSQNKAPVALPESPQSPSQGNLGTGVPTGLGVPSSTVGGQVRDATPGDAPNNLTAYLKENAPSQQDVVSLNKQAAAAGDMSKVNGWLKSDPAIQSAIVTAANNHGIDAVTMAQFAKIESNFKASADRGPKSARGLFQFVPGTWSAYGNGKDIMDPAANADAAARYIAENQRGLTNSLGRTPTAGELYMAHNQGLGGALQIIRACQTGNENLISAKVQANIYNQLKQPMTSCQFSNWCETKMAQTLTDGIPHQPHATPGAKASTAGRKNKDYIAASKNCDVETTMNQDAAKTDNCTNQPANNQDQKKTSPAAAANQSNTQKPATPVYADVPVVDNKGNLTGFSTGSQKLG